MSAACLPDSGARDHRSRCRADRRPADRAAASRPLRRLAGQPAAAAAPVPAIRADRRPAGPDRQRRRSRPGQPQRDGGGARLPRHRPRPGAQRHRAAIGGAGDGRAGDAVPQPGHRGAAGAQPDGARRDPPARLRPRPAGGLPVLSGQPGGRHHRGGGDAGAGRRRPGADAGADGGDRARRQPAGRRRGAAGAAHPAVDHAAAAGAGRTGQGQQVGRQRHRPARRCRHGPRQDPPHVHRSRSICGSRIRGRSRATSSSPISTPSTPIRRRWRISSAATAPAGCRTWR